MKCGSIACIWSDCPPPHQVTATAVLDNPPTLYTGGSDGTIVCWNIISTDSNTVSITTAKQSTFRRILFSYRDYSFIENSINYLIACVLVYVVLFAHVVFVSFSYLHLLCSSSSNCCCFLKLSCELI